jgi:glycosyltransferase involved in cell wall biosynthesis
MQTIIHTEASLGWGGQEIRILSECLWFRGQGFRCILMANSSSKIFEAFTHNGFETIDVAFTKKSQIGDFLLCLDRFRHLRPNMVGTHSNIDTRVALAAAAAAGVPKRIRYRHVSIPVKNSPWNRIIYRKFTTGVITTACSISSALQADFNFRPNHIKTIPTGVDSTNLGDRVEARDAIRRHLNIAPDSLIVSQISVLRAWKGHQYLFEAFDALAADNPRLHLVLVGGGPGMDYLPQQAHALASRDRIHFVGHVEDPYPFFKASDVVALASFGGEGVPQCVLQCFACKTPFVGTRVGGIPDIVKDGENGLLVEPQSSKQLSEAIFKILANPLLADSLAERGLATFDEKGAISRMGASLMEFLQLDRDEPLYES